MQGSCASSSYRVKASGPAVGDGREPDGDGDGNNEPDGGGEPDGDGEGDPESGLSSDGGGAPAGDVKRHRALLSCTGLELHMPGDVATQVRASAHAPTSKSESELGLRLHARRA